MKFLPYVASRCRELVAKVERPASDNKTAFVTLESEDIEGIDASGLAALPNLMGMAALDGLMNNPLYGQGDADLCISPTSLLP